MPPVYPPIAPRPHEPVTQPASSQGRALATADQNYNPDAPEGYAAQLALLDADKRRYLDAAHPIKDALNNALQQPAGLLIKRYAETQAALRAALAAPADSDDPTERPLSVDLDERPAIQAFAETQVAKALLGDMAALALTADRVEGKAGQRRGDVDAETEAQRMRMRATITDLVEDMVERRRAPRVTDATVLDVDATPDVVPDGA